jgi:preprotein translocase subunit YajC
MQIIFLIVMMVAMWALLILPQQRRTKAHRVMLEALEVGDEIVTASGMYGTVTEFDGQTVFLAVNDANEIKITKASIAERVVYADD